MLTNQTFAKDGPGKSSAKQAKDHGREKAKEKNSPANWKLSAAGSTAPADDESGIDLDRFAGTSTHLDRFTGVGAHLLNPEDYTFVGFATYTAADGDELDVVYTGSIVGIDPEAEFIYSVVGKFDVVGGTGRFTHAEGHAKMTGGFTGVPGDLFFELRGTLKLKRK